MTSVRMITKSSPLTLDYTSLFHSLPDAYIVFAIDDPTFTVIDENEAHANIALVKRDEVIGRPLLEAFPDTSEEYENNGESRLIESIRKVIRTGKPDSMPDLKYDLNDSDGLRVQKYWSVTHYPVFDDESKVKAVYQATEDITTRIVAEQKLKLTEYHLSQALSNGAVGTFAWDIEKDVVVTDENMTAMFGLSADDVASGAPIASLLAAIHPDDRERVEEEITRAVESHDTFESEYRTLDCAGDVHWLILRGRVEVDENGKPTNFPGVAVDITERKNAENNLQFLTKASTLFNASLDYRRTLNSIADIVVPSVADWCMIELLDKQDVLQQVAVVHKDPEKVKWAKKLRALQGSSSHNAPSGVARALQTGEVEYYPYITDEMLATTVRDKEQLELMKGLNFSSVIIAPLKLEDRVMGAITLVASESRVHYKPNDVELAKGLANRAALAVYNAELFQSAQQELQERKKFQKQLAIANVNLEKRISKRTKQLETTNIGLEEQISKREEVEKELMRSNQELQDFAYVASHDLQEPLRKIQAFGDLMESEFGEELGEGKEYLNRMRSAAARMSVLIADLLAFSRVTTKASPNVSVNLNTIVRDVVDDLEARIDNTGGRVDVETLPTVRADPTHMRQLFQNLIGNALKFHRPDVPPVVKIFMEKTSVPDGYFTIKVQDNGIGFDEKYLDRIFSVFQRLHGKNQYEGTGIGLAVCRKIAERYGGTITASSKKGEGSTFTFKIPIVDKELNNDNS